MLNRLRWLPILLVLVLVFLPQPVLAIGNPDSISVESIKAYVGIWEEGDMLFVIEYDIDYDPEPEEDPEDTFLFGIWDETDVKGPDIALNYYLHNFISIYLTAAQVTAFGYAKNDELKVKILGNPVYFETLTEGVNMATMSLSAGHWIEGSSLDQTRQYLADWCIVLAEVFEASWGIELLTSSDKLNIVGKLKFEEAIPGLQSVCPDIFQISASYPDDPEGVGNATFQTTLTGRMGNRLSGVLENFGSWFFGKASMGIFIGGAGLAILYFILAGRIFIATGSVPGAIAVSIPFLFVGNLVGVLPLVITFIAAFLCVLTFGILFILGRF